MSASKVLILYFSWYSIWSKNTDFELCDTSKKTF